MRDNVLAPVSDSLEKNTEGQLDAAARVVIDTTNASSVELCGPGPGKAILGCHPPQNMYVRCVRQTTMRSFRVELVMALCGAQ